jgi:hypothetical protein
MYFDLGEERVGAENIVVGHVDAPKQNVPDLDFLEVVWIANLKRCHSKCALVCSAPIYCISFVLVRMKATHQEMNSP